MEKINKPFDLDKALSGEPVQLRCGKHAYVYCVIPNQFTKHTSFSLIGAILRIDNEVWNNMATWTSEGHYMSEYEEDDLDIIGMKYEETI